MFLRRDVEFACISQTSKTRDWTGAPAHVLCQPRAQCRTTFINNLDLDTTMDLSISDLLRLLGEKINVECIRLRETPLSPALPAISVESEVSEFASSSRESSD